MPTFFEVEVGDVFLVHQLGGVPGEEPQTHIRVSNESRALKLPDDEHNCRCLDDSKPSHFVPSDEILLIVPKGAVVTLARGLAEEQRRIERYRSINHESSETPILATAK